MDILHAISNITCDFIKANKGITKEEVIAFVDVLAHRLKRQIKLMDYKIEFPDPPQLDSKSITIRLEE